MILARVKDAIPWLTGDAYIEKLYDARRDPYILDIRMKGTSPGAIAEIDAPDSVFDGETTPVTVSVISDGADTRVVTVIGWIYDADRIDINGVPRPNYIGIETITLTGAVQADGVKTFKRIFHASVLEGDAVREITVIDTATGLTVYLTIAAGATITESNGAAFFCPTGMRAGRIDGDAAMTTMTDVTTSNVTVTEVYDSNGSFGAELLINPHILTAYNGSVPLSPSLSIMSGGWKVTPSVEDVGSANNYYWHFPLIIWNV